MLKSSPEIGELAAALAAAQAEMPAVPKDKAVTVPTKTGGRYTYRYADLASIFSAIRGPLGKAGLSIIQTPGFDNGRMIMTTRLLHKSGQWIEGDLSLLAGDQGPQALGSLITYARRYAVGPMVGVVTDDDEDGNIAEGNHPVVSSAKTGLARAVEQAKAALPTSTPTPAPILALPAPAPVLLPDRPVTVPLASLLSGALEKAPSSPGEGPISAPEAKEANLPATPPQIASQEATAQGTHKCRLDHLRGVAEAACQEANIPPSVLDRQWTKFLAREDGEAVATAWIDAITPESKTETEAKPTQAKGDAAPAGQEILTGMIDKVWPNEDQGKVSFVLDAPTDKLVRKYKGRNQIACYMNVLQEDQDEQHADLSAAQEEQILVSVRGAWHTSKTGKLSLIVHEVTMPALENE